MLKSVGGESVIETLFIPYVILLATGVVTELLLLVRRFGNGQWMLPGAFTKVLVRRAHLDLDVILLCLSSKAANEGIGRHTATTSFQMSCKHVTNMDGLNIN